MTHDSIRAARLAFIGAGFSVLAACGGGGGSGSPAPAPAPTTTSVSSTVIDGAIRNATVCIDKDLSGTCDAGETQGKTDADGKVTLDVPNADVGKYPILAVVGTDAVDADHGAVTVAYTMSAPADQTGVVSPLTTLVQQTVVATGVGSAAAATSVQQATGITASVFADFTKASAPTDGTLDPAVVARLLVVTTQQQQSAVAAAVGTQAIDGKTITQADVDKAVQQKLLEMLPDLVTALSDPAVTAATTPQAKEAALAAAAGTLVTNSGLSTAGVATVVAVNTQNAAGGTPTATPSAGFNLHTLSYSDANNYYHRTIGASLAQATPDANNTTRYVERRSRAAGGAVARWGSGADPLRGADLNWNGSAWVGCAINYENVSSVRDAQGNSTYSYCDARETGRSNRASFDIGGKTMAEVYAQIRAAGYTNLTLADASVLGSATFPSGSSVYYQTNTPLTNAIAYYPSGPGNPIGTANVVAQYSAAVSAGGTASAQAAGTGCNAAESSTNGSSNSATLEAMIASRTGTPCIYAQGSLTYNGTTYQSDASNEWWGNSTVSLGKLGTVPVATNTSSSGYYTGNTLLRVAFTGSGTNPVTYYACKERYVNGSTRNCTAIGTGSYTIATLGDARVMTFNNAPAQAQALNYDRVFVERGGVVYYGYRSKPLVTNTARLNMVGANALLTQLSLPTVDPSEPLTLTAASYQGVWDLRSAGTAVSATNGTTVILGATGTATCVDKETNSGFACTVTITDPSTGAFTFAETGGSATASGTLSFATGAASGTYNDPTSTPSTGSIVGQRR